MNTVNLLLSIKHRTTSETQRPHLRLTTRQLPVVDRGSTYWFFYVGRAQHSQFLQNWNWWAEAAFLRRWLQNEKSKWPEWVVYVPEEHFTPPVKHWTINKCPAAGEEHVKRWIHTLKAGLIFLLSSICVYSSVLSGQNFLQPDHLFWASSGQAVFRSPLINRDAKTLKNIY